MKVYVLTFFSWTDTRPGGVFSTEEAAVARAQELEKWRDEYDFDFGVEELEIDVPVEVE